MRIWPRRKPASPPPPVVLPSLDRLAGLIERVVELVDEVWAVRSRRLAEGRAAAGTSGAVRSHDHSLGRNRRPVPRRWRRPTARGSPSSALRTVTRSSSCAERRRPGNELELNGARYRVVRHSPSPLPGDGRRCAVVEMEEPPEPERTFDG